METKCRLSLFPLKTVLYPDGPLPLRIFEPRYIDLVSECLRTGAEFGVVLIREGQETGEAAATYSMGTTARIVDWHERHDGLLGITVRGQQRFRILNSNVQRNQLTTANVDLLQDLPPCSIDENLQPAAVLLQKIIERVGRYYEEITPRYDDAGWVSWRLAELLPIDLPQKQQLLETEDPILRIDQLMPVLARLHII